jgi:hypothetical protein
MIKRKRVRRKKTTIDKKPNWKLSTESPTINHLYSHKPYTTHPCLCCIYCIYVYIYSVFVICIFMSSLYRCIWFMRIKMIDCRALGTQFSVGFFVNRCFFSPYSFSFDHSIPFFNLRLLITPSIYSNFFLKCVNNYQINWMIVWFFCFCFFVI